MLLDELANETSESAEYLALLIRKGRLAGSKRNGFWYSTPEAVQCYRANVAAHAVPRGRPRKDIEGE